MVKDWRGSVIMVGSTVAYPTRQSSSLWMNEGKVVSIDDERIGVQRTHSTGQPGQGQKISYPDVHRITVVRTRKGAKCS